MMNDSTNKISLMKRSMASWKNLIAIDHMTGAMCSRTRSWTTLRCSKKNMAGLNYRLSPWMLVLIQINIFRTQVLARETYKS